MRGDNWKGPVDDALKAKIIAAYEGGININTIAKEAKIARQTVVNIARAAGVLRIYGRPADAPEFDEQGELLADETHSWRRIAREHLREGTPVSALARKYTVGEDYVRFCLRRAGFDEKEAPNEVPGNAEVCA